MFESKVTSLSLGTMTKQDHYVSVASGKVKINRVNEIIKHAADIITMIQYFRQKHFTLACY